MIRFAIVSAQLEVSKRAVVPARLRARRTDAARAHGAQGARFLCPAPLALDVRGSPAAQLPRGHPCESDWRCVYPRESVYQNAFALSDNIESALHAPVPAAAVLRLLLLLLLLRAQSWLRARCHRASRPQEGRGEGGGGGQARWRMRWAP